MANQTVRDAAREHAVFLWQVADRLGIHDSQLSRMLRRELPDEECKRLLTIIDEIANERKGVC